MLSGANIVCISSIDWPFNRQNPQETALAFSAWGNRVLFVENTGVRRAELRDVPRLWSRLRNWMRAAGGARHESNNIDVLSPLLLPLPYSRAAASLNARLLLRAIGKWRRGARGPLIVITFLPTPMVRQVVGALRPDLVVYYCIDRLAESSPGAKQIAEWEPKFFADADLVLVTSQPLYDAAAKTSSHVEMLPSGVHVEEFARARAARDEPHPAFAGLRRPVIGFVGSIRDATDLDLLDQAAALAPDLTFMLVGPLFTSVTALSARKNVRLFPAVPHDEGVRYMVRFDVGVLPYALNSFTGAIMPVKLKEYLAAGLPVVSTPLPEVKRFADEHPGLISFASDAAGFVAALRAAVGPNMADMTQQRVDAARVYEWSAQMARMSALIEAALERLSSL